MTKTTRNELTRDLMNLEAILRGETVNGVQIGMSGVSEEWTRNAIQSVAATLASGQFPNA